MRSQVEDDINEVSSVFVQHEPVDVHFGDEPSRTRQEFAKECDINVLMAGYEKTGVISHINQRQPMYVDLSDGPYDLQTAMNVLMEAENSFMSLPAVVRREFDNDPMKFVEFAQNPDNVGKLREWGLADPEQAVEPPLRVQVVPDPGAPEASPAPPAPSAQ